MSRPRELEIDTAEAGCAERDARPEPDDRRRRRRDRDRPGRLAALPGPPDHEQVRTVGDRRYQPERDSEWRVPTVCLVVEETRDQHDAEQDDRERDENAARGPLTEEQPRRDA